MQCKYEIHNEVDTLRSSKRGSTSDSRTLPKFERRNDKDITRRSSGSINFAVGIRGLYNINETKSQSWKNKEKESSTIENLFFKFI